jgi:HPt (histidine-containing phosphotransfer) domain-containing protein
MTDEIVYINVNEGLGRVMNNIKLFITLLEKFKEYTYLSDIKEAIAEGDMKKANDSTHALKGLAANLSFTELYKKVLVLEAQVKEKKVNPDLLAEINDVYAHTLTEADKVIEQYA